MSPDGLLVLLRHGQSTLNAEGRFSGWADCPLTPEGLRQARDAGRALRDAGVAFDVCFASALSRAAATASAVLREMNLPGLPVTRSWRLNERHYGSLEGTSKRDAAARYGPALVEAWRNSPDALPPPLDDADPRHPRFHPAYRGLPPALLPSSESLRTAFARVTDFFEAEIRPRVMSGQRILVVSHGNPVRAIIARLNNRPIGEIPLIAIPNATPFAYAPTPSGALAPLLPPQQCSPEILDASVTMSMQE